jgi:hypothetical protein
MAGGKVIRISDVIPDVRDGLTRIERVILWELHKAKQEFGDRHISTAMLYGRVVEHDIDIAPEAFSRVLARMGAMQVR